MAPSAHVLLEGRKLPPVGSRDRSMSRGSSVVLLTAMPPSRQPGAVPTIPIVRTLARRLLQYGEPVRVLIPESEADSWPTDVELHIGAVTDATAFGRAAAGVEHIFLAGLVGEPLGSLRSLANGLISGGAQRVVVLGSHGSDFDDEISPETWQWSAFEHSMDRHGISRVCLRPTAVLANAVVGGYPIPGSAVLDTISAGETVYEYLPEAPYAFIHEDDVADIAATLLYRNEFHGNVDVSGTTVTAAERVAYLDSIFGTHTPVIELTAERAAQRWRSEGWPEDTIAVMLYALPAFAANPDTSVLRAQEETARALLGKAPRTLRHWGAGLV